MSRYMKSTYEYSKPRKHFGRQPLFQLVPAKMLDSINPNIQDQKEYTLRNPVHREVQVTTLQSENETNTKQVVIHEQGINHTEGGWPREVHPYNEDHVLRYRRRVMHEDNYVHTVLSLGPIMEHYVDQNNAIEMYQAYFDDMTPQKPVEKHSIKIANVFRDPFHRPITCVKWTNEKKSKLVVAYCDTNYTQAPDVAKSSNCYLWDICRQTEPIFTLKPEKPCWKLACSPVDTDLIISGLVNGTVNLFDIREGNRAVSRSSVYNSHHDPITSLLYTHSRTHTEFFTGSSDGQCLWWDSRNLSKPMDRLLMSIKMSPGEQPNICNAESISCLEFDHGLPTKFLCGTDSGLVINGNRMGRSHSEILASYWEAHTGPVRAVQRSHCTLRMFLTCGDWSVRVWSEEVRTTPIIVTRPYRYQVADAAWATQRYSSYMVVCAGGFFYYWDFLRKYKEPVVTLQVSKQELTKVAPHTNGQLVAVGDTKGSLFLLHLSENMIEPDKNDRQLMLQRYARESKREHNLDIRLKEIRLKARLDEEAATNLPREEPPNEEEQIRLTEEEYFKIVKDELLQMEGKTQSSASII